MPSPFSRRCAAPRRLRPMHPNVTAIWYVQDDTHFEIAMEAVRRGLHVLVTKPAVKTLAHHQELLAAARANGVLVRRCPWRSNVHIARRPLARR